MLMNRRNRGRLAVIACHDDCDGNMAPNRVKSFRRTMKRRERNQWKKENS